VRNIVLDTHVIVKDPTILARKFDDVRLIVPVSVLQQIDRFRDDARANLSSLLRRAAAEKTVTIIGTSDVTTVSPNELAIGEIDALIVALAVELTHGNDVTVANPDTLLATDDSLLRRVAEKHGVEVVSSLELEKAFQGTTAASADLVTAAQQVKSKQSRHLLISGLCAVMSIALGQLVIYNIHTFLPWITSFGGFCAIVLLGVFIFWCRSRSRLGYGLVECGFGILAVYDGATNFSPTDHQMIGLMKMVGGLYVIVRGLDNIGKGLKGTTFGSVWHRYFPD
jgi:rRNA-processing protein FCF1